MCACDCTAACGVCVYVCVCVSVRVKGMVFRVGGLCGVRVCVHRCLRHVRVRVYAWVYVVVE